MKELYVYPYSPFVDLRNNDNLPDFADQAVRNRQHDPDVFGVTLSRLFFILPNLISCMAIDSMHGVTGVLKTLTDLRFDSAYADSEFSVHHLVNLINDRLEMLRPLDFVRRIQTVILVLLSSAFVGYFTRSFLDSPLQI